MSNQGDSSDQLHIRSLSEELIEQQRDIRQRMDIQGNVETRPTEGEHIRLRSVTVVEMYLGSEVDALITALEQLVQDEESVRLAQTISEARELYDFASGTFKWNSSVGLPDGVEHVQGIYAVLGRNIVSLVLSFVMNSSESNVLQEALTRDAESLFVVGADSIKKGLLIDAKRHNVESVRESIGRRCRSWIGTFVPGRFSTSQREEMPTFSLISLTLGNPIDTRPQYMSILGFHLLSIVVHFRSRPSLYVLYPRSRSFDSRMMVAFNEKMALDDRSIMHLADSPDFVHGLMSSEAVVDGLVALVNSLQNDLHAITDRLNRFQLEVESPLPVFELHREMLILSRDVYAACSEIEIVANSTSSIWMDLETLDSDRPVRPQSDLEYAGVKRRVLHSMIDALRADEVNLRELVIATSSAIADARNLNLQERVSTQTGTLIRFTRWLIVLTIVLTVTGVATLLYELIHN